MSRTLALFLVVAAVALTLSYAAHGAPPDLPAGGALYVVDSTTVAHVPSPVSAELGTVTLVILGLGLASAVLRRMAGASHALQTPGGLLVMAVLSAAITGVTAAATTYGLNWRALLAAGISGATSAMCAWNPSAAKQAAAAMLLFVGVSLTGCASMRPAQHAAWTTLGVNAEKCVDPMIHDAATTAVADLATLIASPKLGEAELIAGELAVAIKDGIPAVVCAVGHLYSDAKAIVDESIAAMQPPRPSAPRVQLLLKHLSALVPTAATVK